MLAIFQYYEQNPYGVPFYKFDLHSNSPLSIAHHDSISYHPIIMASSISSLMRNVVNHTTQQKGRYVIKLVNYPNLNVYSIFYYST